MNLQVIQAQNDLCFLSQLSVKGTNIKGFADRADSVASVIKNIFEKTGSVPLEESYRQRLIKVVEGSNKHIIGQLYRYAIKGEGDKRPFYPNVRDRIIEYLRGTDFLYLPSDDVYIKCLKAFIDKLGSCDVENNKID